MLDLNDLPIEHLITKFKQFEFYIFYKTVYNNTSSC